MGTAGAGAAALPHGDARPRAVSFGGKPLWDERALGMTDVDGVDLRGGAAVVAGRSASGERLVAADARTGAVHRSAGGGAALLGGDGAVAHGGTPDAKGMRACPVGPSSWRAARTRRADGRWSSSTRRDRTGRKRWVAALSARDGRVLWKHAVFRDADDYDREQETRLLGTDGRVVLVAVRSPGRLRLRTVALDAASGRALWEHKDGWAFRIDGGTVLGRAARGGRGRRGRSRRAPRSSVST